MAAAKKPQDHLAKAEAREEDAVFDFDGVTYTIPRAQLDNVELLEMIEDGKNITAMRGYVGAEQWAKFKDQVRTPDGRVPGEPTGRFLDLVTAQINPNSQASPTS